MKQTYISLLFNSKIFISIFVLFFAFNLNINAQSPGGISSGLSLWLRADKGTGVDANSVPSSGSVVGTWYDQSSSVHNGTSVNNTQTYSNASEDLINFNPTVKADYTNNGADRYKLPNNTCTWSSNPLTYFAIIKAPTATNTEYLFFSGGTVHNVSSGYWYYTGINGSDQYYTTMSGNKNGLALSAHKENQVDLVGFTYNKSNKYAYIFLQGDQKSSVRIYNASTNSYKRTANKNHQILTNFTGNAAELISYPATLLDDLEIQKINSYLALKYGVTLDQTSEYDYVASDGSLMWDASVNGSYKYDIFGLGRDDSDLLYQRVSHSVNDSAILAVSLNNDFTSSNIDASRTSDVITDLNFMTFSDNGGDTIFNITNNLPADSVSCRMAKIWRVSKTNDFPSMVNLKFDLASADTATYLLYKTTGVNGDFTSGNSTYLGTLDTKGEISGITLNDGEFFTLFSNITNVIYNENQGVGKQSVSGTLPLSEVYKTKTIFSVSGNVGNLQRNAADSLILIGWSPSVPDCKDVEIASDKPADLILGGNTTLAKGLFMNLYAVWAYDMNGNGIPDCDEPYLIITPVNEWPGTNTEDSDMPDWYPQYDRNNRDSWYAGCEMTLNMMISPDPYNDRMLNIKYLGALKKGYVVDSDGNPLQDTYIMAKGDSLVTLHVVLVEDFITSENEGQMGAIEIEVVGGGSMSAWFYLYSQPSYESVLVKPYIRSDGTVDFGINGGSPNLMRSINGGPWRNAYLPLNSAEQQRVTDGASIWLREPNGCWEEKFFFLTYDDQVVIRYVNIESASGVITTPGFGKHYVEGHKDFTFTASFAGGVPLKVMANGYYTSTNKELTGLDMNDGTYKYTIRQVTEPWTITFGPELASGTVGNEDVKGVQVWSYNDNLYIRSESNITACVYNMSGTLCKRLMLAGGCTVEPMPQGIYVVVIGNARYKIFVK